MNRPTVLANVLRRIGADVSVDDVFGPPSRRTWDARRAAMVALLDAGWTYGRVGRVVGLDRSSVFSAVHPGRRPPRRH